MIRRSLTAKVTLAALVGLVCVLGMAGFGLANLLSVGAVITRMNIHVTGEIQLVAQFHTSLARALSEGQSFALAGDSQSFAQALALLNQAEATLTQLRKITEKDDGIDDPATRDAYNSLHSDRASLLATIKDIISTIESSDAATRQESAEALEQLEARLSNLDATARRLIELEEIAATNETDAAITWGAVSVGTGFGIVIVLGIAALVLLRWQVVAPLKALASSAEALAGGKLDQVVRVTSADEIGALQTAFNQMSAAICAQTASLEREIAVAHIARQEAEQAQIRIADQLAQIDAQQIVIREMSVPVLPLTAKTLVMPLVGALDTGRLMLLQEQALRAIERSQAHYLLLDVTGVSVVDTQVALGLIGVTQAVRLLGAEAVLVGIRPEVAQSIVGLGIQLDSVTTRASLQSGIAYALGQRVN
jgi:rsbT co-antagonist protein RsbR